MTAIQPGCLEPLRRVCRVARLQRDDCGYRRSVVAQLLPLAGVTDGDADNLIILVPDDDVVYRLRKDLSFV